MPKPDKDTTKKKKDKKNTKKKKKKMQNSNLSIIQIQQYIKMIICHAKVGFISEMKSLFNIRKLMTSHYINRLKRKMI